MRKYLAGGVALAVAAALGGTAIAQDSPTATLNVKLTPTKAGTKKKPKNGKISLSIVNDDSNRTMDNLKIWLPANGKLSLKGLKSCSEETIASLECPKSAALGSGLAEASQGINTGAPQALFFKVTPFPTSKTKIAFLLQQLVKDASGNATGQVQSGGITVIAPGTLKKAKKKPYGQLLDIDVPQLAREFPTGSFNGLVSLKTTLSKKKGKHFLVSTTGCIKKGYAFKAQLRFMPNPDPANAGVATDTFKAKCK